MGCDIHTHIEILENNIWVEKNDKIFYDSYYGNHDEIFCWRSYRMFNFLNGVRPYSKIPEQEWWDRGLPDDSKIFLEDDYFFHSPTYIYLKELLDFDYNQIVEDRRCTSEEGKGLITTYKDFLPECYFNDLEIAKNHYGKNVRIILYFDN